MAFDRNNPADLLALKTEVNTDPIGMGYNPTGSTQQLLNLLNDGDNNVGGETVGEALNPRLLIDAIAQQPDVLTPGTGQNLSQGEVNFVLGLIGWGGAGAAEFVNLEPYRAAISVMLPSGAAKTALDGQSRRLSRAEVLFGEGTVLDRDDVNAARNS